MQATPGYPYYPPLLEELFQPLAGLGLDLIQLLCGLPKASLDPS